MSYETTNRNSGSFRWTVRILSILYLAFFLFMLTAHLVPDGGNLLHSRFLKDWASYSLESYSLAIFWHGNGTILGGALGVVATIGFQFAVGGVVILRLIMAFPGFLFLLCRPLSHGGSDAEGSS